MGNYLADGLNAGFATGSEAYHRKKEREQRERETDLRSLEAAADRKLRRELLDKDIAANDPLRAAQAAHLNANAARTTALTPAEVAEAQARARGLNVGADRTAALTPGEVAELNARARSINATATHTETMTPLDAEGRRVQNVGAQLANDLADMRLNDLRRKFDAGPAAKVEQSVGPGSKAEFTVPLAQAQRMAAAANYQSPYADRIAAFDEQLAQHEAEMQGGDERSGLFNLKSRQDEHTKLTQRRTRLQALEIQDMLRKGVIDEAEADRRAAKLLPFR